VLGFYVTGHPLGSYAAALRRFADTTGATTEGKEGREVRVGGLVTALRELRTRKGDLMAFGTLEDLEGAFDLTIFPEPFARLGALLKANVAEAETGSPTPILVTGTLEAGETPKLLVRDVITLAGAEEKLASKLRLRVMAGEATRDRLLALRRVLKAYPGECSVTVHLTIPGESETVLALADPGGVRPVPDLLRDVDALFGRPVTELSL
jgi:DNA polymerase-3 subunit alpha